MILKIRFIILTELSLLEFRLKRSQKVVNHLTWTQINIFFELRLTPFDRICFNPFIKYFYIKVILGIKVYKVSIAQKQEETDRDQG